RHTRSKRDWSSDVCSSDLKNRPGAAARVAAIAGRCTCAAKPTRSISRASFLWRREFNSAQARVAGRRNDPCCHPEWSEAESEDRSEERRVGKEGRGGWWEA